jgi:hypothetical protein
MFKFLQHPWKESMAPLGAAAPVLEMTDIRLQVLMAGKMPNVVFWVVMPYSLVSGYQYFKGTYRLHLQE